MFADDRNGASSATAPEELRVDFDFSPEEQTFADQVGHRSHIGGDTHRRVACGDDEIDRIGGVVRQGVRIEVDVPQAERFIVLKGPYPFLPSEHLLLARLKRAHGHPDREAETTREHSNTFDVVRMLMTHHNCLKA